MERTSKVRVDIRDFLVVSAKYLGVESVKSAERSDLAISRFVKLIGAERSTPRYEDMERHYG